MAGANIQKPRGSLIKIPAKGYLLIWATDLQIDGRERLGGDRSGRRCSRQRRHGWKTEHPAGDYENDIEDPFLYGGRHST